MPSSANTLSTSRLSTARSAVLRIAVRVVAACRLVADPVDLEIVDVVGEALHHAVAPGDLPAGGERRDLAREVLGEGTADGLHRRLGSSE
jgi:hypothetical protein